MEDHGKNIQDEAPARVTVQSQGFRASRKEVANVGREGISAVRVAGKVSVFLLREYNKEWKQISRKLFEQSNQ